MTKAFSILIFLLLNYTNGYSQISQVEKDYARRTLDKVLNGIQEENVMNNDSIILIKDEKTAIEVALPIVYSIYGKKHIKKEKPYKAFLVDNYWVVKGSLPRGFKGGTFYVILDSRNCKIIHVIHGK